MRIFCRSAAHLGLLRVFFTNLSWNGSLGSDSGFVERLLKQWSLPQCTQPSVLRNHGGALSKMWWPGSILLETISGYTNPDQRIPKWFSELLCFLRIWLFLLQDWRRRELGSGNRFPRDCFRMLIARKLRRRLTAGSRKHGVHGHTHTLKSNRRGRRRVPSWWSAVAQTELQPKYSRQPLGLQTCSHCKTNQHQSMLQRFQKSQPCCRCCHTWSQSQHNGHFIVQQIINKP